MNRVRYEYRFRELSRRFPHRVEAPVPARGLGKALTAMTSWCNERHGPEGWANLHRSERSPKFQDWAVFAFPTAEDAAAFRKAWTDHITFEEAD